MKRNPEARFMGGAWVFPGGAVDREEGAGDGALRAAAIREVAEEAGIELGDGGPRSVLTLDHPGTGQDPLRHVVLPPDAAGAEPAIDGSEIVDARWYEPDGALEAISEGELLLVFPTIKHLEQLSGFASADALLDYARTREIRPVEPQVIMSGERARVLLPGDPGYEESA